MKAIVSDKCEKIWNVKIMLFFQMMHGSKRNEIVLFRANADLAQPVTYFIPEVLLWKLISRFQISKIENFCSKKIFLVVLSNWSGLFGGWRDSAVGFGVEKTSLYWRRWQSNSYKGNFRKLKKTSFCWRLKNFQKSSHDHFVP